MDIKIEQRFVNSLVKVFEDEELKAPGISGGTALRGELYSLQFAYWSDFRLDNLKAEIESPLAEYMTVRRVASVPVRYTGPTDDDVLRSTPGLYPDLLTGFDRYRASDSQWHSLWITVKIPADIAPGVYPLKLKLSTEHIASSEYNVTFESGTFELKVLEPVLPEQTLFCTEWFHADCIAGALGLEIWSEPYWKMLEKYFRNMIAHGVNVIYTPLFTPPLDTKVGGERLTTQLIGVKFADGKYSFDFSKAERWLRLAKECGFKRYEMSHLFTQWGAKFTPKIMVECGGVEEKRFGWHVPANSPEYAEFLDAFLPELRNFLRREGIEDDTLIHISDEPHGDHLESYAAAVGLVRRHLDGMKFLDALSSADFYRNKLVGIPVPSSQFLPDFDKLQVPERWVYYCCSEWNKLSNQFIHMPSSRNRIMGILMYYCGVEGFLHWGFNFYNSQFSLYPVNPYMDLDAGGGFPAGDSFKVYPGVEGPEDSIRHEVFNEGLQDMRALQLLERLIGREETLAFLKSAAGMELNMDTYPRSADWLFNFREALNLKLAELTADK